MKIQCTQENLKKALSATERVTGKKSTLPILENILFEVKGGKAIISATNLELGVVVHLPAKIEREGRIAVPVRILGAFVSNLGSDAVVDIAVNATVMHVASEKHSAVIQGFDAEDFPLIPHVAKEECLYSIDSSLFRSLVQKNMVSVSPSNIRAEFTGVFLGFFGEELRMASTDSFRLVETKMRVTKIGDPEDQSVIVPHQTAQEVARLLSEVTGVMMIAIRDGQIFFHIGDGVFLMSRTIQGTFPDYAQIIPKTFSTTARVSKEVLSQALHLALAFLAGGVGEAVFSLRAEEGVLTVRTESEKTGKNTSVLPADISGASLDVAFNPKYVSDALGVTEGEDVMLSLNTESSPALFMPVAKEGEERKYLYVLMPIKK